MSRVAALVWLGRHQLLPAEMHDIAKLGVTRYVRFTEPMSVKELMSIIRGLLDSGEDIVYVSGTAPLGFWKRLLEAVEGEGRVVILWPEMERIAEYVDEATARRIAEENPERRSYRCYAPTDCTVWEYRGFQVLRRIDIVTEPLHALQARGQEESAKNRTNRTRRMHA